MIYGADIYNVYNSTKSDMLVIYSGQITKDKDISIHKEVRIRCC